MEIKLIRQDKMELLKACQTGILETDKLTELKTELDKRRPARVLTPAEAKEYLGWLERSC